MSRTIPWETIKDWFAQHEQTLRDVGRFEGLRGVVNEVLRLAPDQPELAALRGELASVKEVLDATRIARDAEQYANDELRKILTAAEQRNANPNIEAAAQKLAACMDYPWEFMPEQGRASMREHAKAVIDAALKPKSGASE